MQERNRETERERIEAHDPSGYTHSRYWLRIDGKGGYTCTFVDGKILIYKHPWMVTRLCVEINFANPREDGRARERKETNSRDTLRTVICKYTCINSCVSYVHTYHRNAHALLLCCSSKNQEYFLTVSATKDTCSLPYISRSLARRARKREIMSDW